MYGHLLDFPDQDTIQPGFHNGAETGTTQDMFTTRYQRERQRVYDRAAHMADTAGYTHADVEDAKSEAAVVRAEAQVSRARGDQIGWVRHMLRGAAVARLGYRSPAEMVASRLDTKRSVATELVYLAERLGDHQIEQIRAGAVSYERVLAETRLAEAGASVEVIEGSRDLDLEEVGRLLQSHRKMSRQDERAVFEGQYISIQPSLDGRPRKGQRTPQRARGRHLPPRAWIAEANGSFRQAKPTPMPAEDEPWPSPPYARTNWTGPRSPPSPQPPNVSGKPAADGVSPPS